jgi:hypothetical protein
MADVIASLAQALAAALRPLASALEAADDSMEQFSREIGYELPSVPPSLAALKDAGDRLTSSLDDLNTAAIALAEETGSQDDVLSAAGLLLLDVGLTFGRIEDLRNSLGTELPAPFVAATNIVQDFPTRLYEFLVHSALHSQVPLAAHILNFLGIIEAVPQEADTNKFQPEFVLRRLRIERFAQLLQDPAGLFRDVYGWGTPKLDAARLFEALRALSFHLVYPARIEYPSPVSLEALGVDTAVPEDDGPDPELILPVIETDVGVVSLVLYPVQTKTATELQGLAATVIADAGITASVDITPELKLDITASVDLSAGVAAVVRPDAPVALVDQVSAGGLAAVLKGAGAKLRLGWKPQEEGETRRLIDLPGDSFIESRELYLQVEVSASAAGLSDFGIAGGVLGGRLVLQSKDADSFLTAILPKDGIIAPFEFGLGWSTARGIYFQGSAGFETTIPIHAQLGPLFLDSLHVALLLNQDAVNLEASITGGAAIGPIAVTVERVGARAQLAFRKGNLGALDLVIGFKSPTGIGAVVDAGPITGGGFLSIDTDNGRYAGILQLRAFEIGITAIALIDTKLPGGQEGYSFLIIIAVELPPIQLGYGFTLNGVGGLAGIHRTMVVEAIQAGIRNHSVDHILFPENPVQNAAQIISDLRAIFPPAMNRFVFGPMAKIGWGTPTLITVELGIIIELPAPVRLVLLGQISALIPTPDAPVVELHIDILGILDFEGQKISVDAVIHDSRVAAFSISGDMAFRLSWGSQPNFAMSVGGLNPRFQPPPGFPELRRITLSLGFEDNPRISVEAYFAVTSNTLQFGAKAELYAEAGGFNVLGWMAFDALLQVIPLYFAIDFDVGVALRRGSSTLAGVRLTGSLTGPSPYHVKGEASLSLLFFDVSVPFDRTFGVELLIERPLIDAWNLLEDAIKNVESWTAALPAHALEATTSRVSADAPPLLVDPVGGARLRERVVPLNRNLDKLGEAVLTGAKRFDITEVRAGSNVTHSYTLTQDQFARAQFENLTDAEKLSAPSFQAMDAGIEFGSDAVSVGAGLTADLTYETRIVDFPYDGRTAPKHQFPRGQLLAMLGAGAAARAPNRNKGSRKFAPSADRELGVGLGEESYVIATTSDLTVRADLALPSSKGDAHAALKAHLARNPKDRDQLQVIAQHEEA